ERRSRGPSIGGTPLFRSGLLTAAFFAHRFTAHLDAVSVVYQPVEDGVGQGWIADLLVPAGERDLAGENRGPELIAILADLQEVAPLAFGQRGMSPIIDDEHVDAGQPGQP